MTNLTIEDPSLQRVVITMKRKGGNAVDRVEFILGTRFRLEVTANEVSPTVDGDRNAIVTFEKAQEVIAKHVARRLKAWPRR